MNVEDVMYVAGIELPSAMLIQCMPEVVTLMSIERMKNVKNDVHNVKYALH